MPTSSSEIDAFAESERVAWSVPGLALAVVKDDKIIHMAGYGLRDVARNLPMTPRTLCAIASVTKSMTVSTLAALVRQGKLEWDRPVREYLPEFRLFDPVATERVTTRDLVTHRTGIPRHDWVWYGSGTPTRAELMERLRYLPPSRDLREAWQYNNLMYVAAGYLAGRLAGSTWEEAIRRLLFAPLGMERAGTSIPDLLRADDFAVAYRKGDDEAVHAVPYYDASGPDGIDPLGPAGSVVAGVEEMARYIRMQLSLGRFEGVEVIAEADARAMQSPQMVMPDEGAAYPETGPTQYGMGFRLFNYRGHRIVRHGGALDGFSTNLAFLPDDGIGLIAIANISGSVVPQVMMYGIFDRLLGLDPVLWSDRYRATEAAGKASEQAATNQGLSPRRTGTKPAHPVADYAGSYAHPAYGTVEITHTADNPDDLEIGYHGFTSPLRHFHFEVWETPRNKMNHLERTRIAFDTDWNGDIASVRIPFEPQIADIVFVRQPDPALSTREVLAPLAGDYAISDAATYCVRVREGGEGTGVELALTLPDRPTPFALRPVRVNVFDVLELAGMRVEFVWGDADGEDGGSRGVTGMAVHEAEGSYLAGRVG